MIGEMQNYHQRKNYKMKCRFSIMQSDLCWPIYETTQRLVRKSPNIFFQDIYIYKKNMNIVKTTVGKILIRINFSRTKVFLRKVSLHVAKRSNF